MMTSSKTLACGKTRDLRVLWALEEMGLPYEVVGMDHPQRDLDTPAYRALNPFGQIPMIDDNGVVVTESGAILLYLARRSGKLMPREAPRRALDRRDYPKLQGLCEPFTAPAEGRRRR
ncbi:glutathione S-transferase N-terminal domain-containing protein [Corallococcus exercitus]|nr:glutathione S-transferase N-terminal domain-containing protein [Corallococcus exercitus]